MSVIRFIERELAAAVARGVRQCVVVGSPLPGEISNISNNAPLKMFAVNTEQAAVLPASFVPGNSVAETLDEALERSEFDKLKASLFIWIGSAAYRTVDAVIAGLGFIGSLPRGSGVLLDYAVERTSVSALTHTALDAMASRLWFGGGMKFMVESQAVAALLRGVGFQQIVDHAQDEVAANGVHLVSAMV